MKIKINIDLRVGRIVKYFIFADLALLAGWGLVQPIFAIYLIDKIEGATLVTVGIASSVYWLLKSILQLPVAKYLDRHTGESDDFLALVIGLFIVAFSAVALIFIEKPWHLYIVQVIYAIGFSLYVPSWSGIFSRHLDKDKVSFDWSLDSTAVGLAAGVSGVLGGVIAEAWGVPGIFAMAAGFSVGSALVVMAIPDLVFPKKTTDPTPFKDHTPTNLRH